MATLVIKPLTPHAALLYTQHLDTLSMPLRDAGFDVFVTKDVTIDAGGTALVPLGIAAFMLAPPDCACCSGSGSSSGDVRTLAYDLRARSSIYKTYARLANGVGLIDAGYRGELMAAVDNRSHRVPLHLTRGARLFQLVRCDGAPFSVRMTREDTDAAAWSTERGTKGFGSTGSGCASTGGGGAATGGACASTGGI